MDEGRHGGHERANGHNDGGHNKHEKDKWNVHELHNMLVQEEMMLKNQGIHSVYYVSHQGNQEVGKSFVKNHDKGKKPLKINDGPVQIKKKASCKEVRHLDFNTSLTSIYESQFSGRKNRTSNCL